MALNRRMPKKRNGLLYVYVTARNCAHAKSYGKKNFGSFSAYIDALLEMDRKDKICTPPPVKVKSSGPSADGTLGC